MKKLFLYFVIFTLFFNNGFAQNPDSEIYRESCTSIMLGKLASDDGSVVTAHTCDAYYRTWLDFVPAQKYQKGAMHKIYWETMHTHTAWSNDKLVYKGEIPEVAETYAYLNTAYPCLNEKQLAIGETSIFGRDTLKNVKGLFLIEELQRIALQRCTTARDAIKLIGQMIKQYGYADGGECITIADTKEVWQMEIYGEGPDKIGGVWAAQRVPDDHVGISANLARIAELNLKDANFFMASDNVFEVAKKLKFWDGKETFKFWKVYGTRKPFTIREYFVFTTLAPDLKLQFDSEELPFSVKVAKKVNIRQILELYRATYENTEWDPAGNLKVAVTKKDENGNKVTDTVISPAAHPWFSRAKKDMVNALEQNVVNNHRPIAVQYCAYSWVAQLRADLPDEIGGKIWFSFDVPRLSPRVPIYCGNLSVPQSYKVCGQDYYSRESALWAFRQTNRLAMVSWGETKNLMDSLVMHYENKAFNEVNQVEKHALELYKLDMENAKAGKNTQLCREFLTSYSNDFARSTIDRWWELGSQLWVLMRWKF